MAALRPFSAVLCLTFALEPSNSFGSLCPEEWPPLSTRSPLTGASSLSSSCRTVKSQVSSVSLGYLKSGE